MAAASIASPPRLGRNYQQRQHVLKSRPLGDTSEKEPSYCHRPAPRTKKGHDTDTEQDDDIEGERSRHHRHRHSAREDCRPEDRIAHSGRGTPSVQSMTSWLDRLVLAEEEDEEEEEEEEEDDTPTAYSQGMQDDGHLHRQKRAYRHDHYDYRGHGGRHTPSYSGPYAEREAGVRTRSPPASYHSRSSSRSPSPRRRAIVPVHSNSRDGDRYRGRDRIGYDRHDRHERRITRQEGYGDVHTRKASPHGRSAAGRSDSHSRRRPPLKRGPSSSSSASNNSSSSMSAWESAARNALRAGTMAALSSHSAPGSWLGHKGTRVATAALGAALVDTYMGHRHPESVNGVRHTAMRQAAEYAINSIVAEPILQRAARRRTRR